MLRRSLVRLRAGPGPTLCIPITTTNTDGPYRTKKFKLPHIPKDYNNHLPTADVSRLVGQAEQYLLNPEAPFSNTWADFVQRCKESLHLFQPIDIAIILRTLDERNADPQNLLISKIMSSQLQTQQYFKIPGHALVTYFDIYATRMPLAQPMIRMLCNKVPESLNELSVNDIIKILQSLEVGRIKNSKLCHKVYRKIMARIFEMNCTVPFGVEVEIGEVSTIFAYHEFRNLELYNTICQRVQSMDLANLKSQSNQISKIFDGFFLNSLDPFPLYDYLRKHLNLSRKLPNVQFLYFNYCYGTQLGQVRHGKSKAGKKIDHTYKLALLGHQQYLKHLQHPTEVHEVDPALLPYGERVRSVFARQQKIMERAHKSLDSVQGVPLRCRSDGSKYKGLLLKHEFPKFGIGLQTLERGGKEMINDVFTQVKLTTAARTNEVIKLKEILEDPDRGGSSDFYSKTLKEAEQMVPGDVVLVKSSGMITKAKAIAFVVVPYSFEGSELLATQTLRTSIHSGLEQLIGVTLPGYDGPATSLSLPCIGSDIHGFHPRRITPIIIEECIDILLQLDVIKPNYSLKSIQLVDPQNDLAKHMAFCLDEAAARWIPQYHVVTAAQYHGERSQRLIKIPNEHLIRLRSREKYWIKKYSPLKRPPHRKYNGHIRPHVWRVRVRRSASMPVFKATGKAAGVSIPSKVYMTSSNILHRGVKRMKVKNGEWVANQAQPEWNTQRLGLS